MLKLEKNNLSFDTNACMQALVKYFVQVLEEADEKYISLMADELMKAAAAPRDMSSRIAKWREQVRSALKESGINVDLAGHKVESMVGIEGDGRDEIWRKGAILQMGGGPDHAGPYGRIVWDGDYAGQHPSLVKTSVPRKLPESWKLEGIDWLRNATRRMQTFYGNYLARAEGKIPSGFYAQFMRSG